MLRRTLFMVLMLVAMQSVASDLQKLDDNSHGLTRYLLEFEHQQLRQYALFIVGSEEGLASDNLIVMAHGYHPSPANYGRLASGESRRPGEYYRQWVEAYALAGFNVLVPDYRGHNQSQGFEFTHQAGTVEFPEQHYASDLLASLSAMQHALPNRIGNIALIGHSMGSPIAFYAASKLDSRVKLVSLWSSAKYRFGGIDDRSAVVPFIIHHGEHDTSTPLHNSDYYRLNFADKLLHHGVYQTDKHMLEQSDFASAIAIDVGYIKHYFYGQADD
ncbi:alpha/beta hydrolase family protein [Thalassotalea litorea]|uniref:alpha/beta hydrolase family protein n=1 Tax=Thalassotalea litorea TaxID=2020715 RepID=UPI003736B3A1